MLASICPKSTKLPKGWWRNNEGDGEFAIFDLRFAIEKKRRRKAAEWHALPRPNVEAVNWPSDGLQRQFGPTQRSPLGI